MQVLPDRDFGCCVSLPVALNPYSQVTYETNRYSVPVEAARAHLTLKAYPFRLEVWDDTHLLTTHPRSYQRDQDLFDPLHYLALLEQRPGAFEHARPLREWRTHRPTLAYGQGHGQTWPPVYEQLLAHLRRREPEHRSVREFVLILKLHGDYPAADIAQAIQQALTLGRADLEGIRLCLHQLHEPTSPAARLDLSTRPQLASLGQQQFPF